MILGGKSTKSLAEYKEILSFFNKKFGTFVDYVYTCSGVWPCASSGTSWKCEVNPKSQTATFGVHYLLWHWKSIQIVKKNCQNWVCLFRSK